MKAFKFDPATGWSTPSPYPSEATQWREHHGQKAWLFNPWTGERRCAEDVGSDTFGHLMSDGVTPLRALGKKDQ